MEECDLEIGNSMSTMTKTFWSILYNLRQVHAVPNLGKPSSKGVNPHPSITKKKLVLPPPPQHQCLVEDPSALILAACSSRMYLSFSALVTQDVSGLGYMLDLEHRPYNYTEPTYTLRVQ